MIPMISTRLKHALLPIVMAWCLLTGLRGANAQTFTDTFNRSNGAVSNGWVNVNSTSTWAIASNTLTATSSNISGYTTDYLVRPSGENRQDTEVDLTTAAGGISIQGQAAVLLRRQSNGDTYLLSVAAGATSNLNGMSIYKIVSGSVGALTSGNGGAVVSCSPNVNNSDRYLLKFKAVGVNPTTLTIVVYDQTTSTTVGTTSITDSTASTLQNGTGAPGLCYWIATSGTFTNTYTEWVSGPPATAGTIGLSPPTATTNSNQSIAVTGTGTSFSGSPFTLSSTIPGCAIVSQSVASATSATVVISGGVSGGTATLTDTGSGATATITVSPPNLGPLLIGAVGDSITAGTNGNPIGNEQAYLTALGYSCTITNQGLSGRGTQDWLPTDSSGNLTNAVAAMKTANCTIVQIMLGTNDARTPSQNNTSLNLAALTPSQHFANMSAIVSTLVSNGFTVVINRPIWSTPANALNGGTVFWPANVNQTYAQYWALDSTLVDGVHVFTGEDAAWMYFRDTPSALQDGVHPTSITNPVLGEFWAEGILAKLPTVATTGTAPAAPTVTAQPVSQAITTGGTATFAVAFAGYPAATIQWRVSTNSGSTWTNITGATTGTYTTGTLTTANTGTEYDAVATNTQGSVTSAAATVTVSTGISTTTLALTITHNGFSQPVLTWVADPSATSYKVMRSTDGAAYTVIATPAAGTLTYTDTTEPIGTIRYVVVSVH